MCTFPAYHIHILPSVNTLIHTQLITTIHTKSYGNEAHSVMYTYLKISYKPLQMVLGRMLLSESCIMQVV